MPGAASYIHSPDTKKPPSTGGQTGQGSIETVTGGTRARPLATSAADVALASVTQHRLFRDQHAVHHVDHPIAGLDVGLHQGGIAYACRAFLGVDGHVGPMQGGHLG